MSVFTCPFRHWSSQVSSILCCCLIKSGLSWTACGKPLVLKSRTSGAPDLSINLCPELATVRFPTGYSGLWKTLVLVPRFQDFHLTGQVNSRELATAGFPQPLLHYKNLLLLLEVLFSVERSQIVRAQAAHHNRIRLGGPGAALHAER